jgi:hypothetical protein
MELNNMLDEAINQLGKMAMALTRVNQELEVVALTETDGSRREQARQLLAENEAAQEGVAVTLLNHARHENPNVRKASLRAMAHIERNSQ